MARCEITGWYHKRTDTHHIKTRGSGGTDSPDNLVEVCRFHHVQIHSGKIATDGCYASVSESEHHLVGATVIREYLKHIVARRNTLTQWIKEIDSG